MQLHEIPLEQLEPASWNSNAMDEAMVKRLKNSLDSFGMLQPLVVRKLDKTHYEIIGGSHRFRIIEKTHASTAPCVIVDVGDAEARLLALALNRIEGEDDVALKAGSFRQILEQHSEKDVLALLPETEESLAELVNFDSITPDDFATSWQKQKKTRLKHFSFRVTKEQLATVEEAIALVPDEARIDPSNPNERDNALAYICLSYIERENKSNSL